MALSSEEPALMDWPGSLSSLSLAPTAHRPPHCRPLRPAAFSSRPADSWQQPRGQLPTRRGQPPGWHRAGAAAGSCPGFRHLALVLCSLHSVTASSSCPRGLFPTTNSSHRGGRSPRVQGSAGAEVLPSARWGLDRVPPEDTSEW